MKINFNLIKKVIFDDKKVDLLIELMILVNRHPKIEDYFNNVKNIEKTKIYLKNLFKERDFYVVFYNLNRVEFYKIGESFVLTENLENYSVKNSTFNILDKRKSGFSEFLTFDLKTMSSKNSIIMEKSNLIKLFEKKAKEIEKSLHFLEE